MSDEQKKPSVYDGVKVLMPEQLKGKRVSMTITAFDPVKIQCTNGDKAEGFSVRFKEYPKPLEFQSKTARKQLTAVFGTEDYREYVGKKVCVFTHETKVGMSWRFAAVEVK